MRRLAVIAAVLACGTLSARADDTCMARATAKKLAGAAQTSFLKKCARDAAATCDGTAAGKKLAGAARTSFTKKCVSDAVGS